MQHTTQYQFNLVEGSDTLSPHPLNENAEKTETILAELADGVAQAGNCKITVGSYTGTGTYGSSGKSSLTFEHAPALVFLHSRGGSLWGVLIAGATKGMLFVGSAVYGLDCIWSSDGKTVQWSSSNSEGYQLNNSGQTYQYLIFG